MHQRSPASFKSAIVSWQEMRRAARPGTLVGTSGRRDRVAPLGQTLQANVEQSDFLKKSNHYQVRRRGWRDDKIRSAPAEGPTASGAHTRLFASCSAYRTKYSNLI